MSTNNLKVNKTVNMPKKEVHKKAFLTNFELACEFGILICLTDMLWLAHDIFSNGLSIWYMLVGGGLTLGLIGTIWVLWRHHKVYTHRLVLRIRNNRRKAKQLAPKRLAKERPVVIAL